MATEVPEGHDRGAKRLLGHPKVVADLLRAFVPSAWLEGIDYERLQPSFTEHVDAGLARRTGDIAWTTTYGSDAELAVLIKAQSTCDYAMAPRVSALAGMLAEYHARRHRDQPLPNLPPIVYYTGRSHWTARNDLVSLTAPPPIHPRRLYARAPHAT
ncbi:MAG: Rpn family recombination-promoting nuclease/putative transposase, partial [Gammaproteobacteria bacterium]|nr:Rpn family recombination-promoting nuclease/putative transposase [Gammaproteobacteria bacterium]